MEIDVTRPWRVLSELFDGRSQLIVYHFMFDPNWEAGCPHCSFWADNFNGIETEKAQINRDSPELLKEACAYRSDLCIDGVTPRH